MPLVRLRISTGAFQSSEMVAGSNLKGFKLSEWPNRAELSFNSVRGGQAENSTRLKQEIAPLWPFAQTLYYDNFQRFQEMMASFNYRHGVTEALL
ncbi:hypothetical protein BIW11_02868 [Tropilaelaps mercedesae]|uniref:Uncharacterized protein n=1 Tax=Tropilaelaps mercedesae TaxID=418985 RepID=A0A1V9XW13_9ACAR|nr:hypothetical protein BIW11_02868 [Tropilaelaps mercedesae]